MKLKSLILVPGLACALVLAGCSSDDSADTAESATSTVATGTSAAASGSSTPGTPNTTSCPSGITTVANPAWTVQGKTGSVSITAPTDVNGPLIETDGEFVVDKTQIKVLSEGAGAAVASGASVTVCYEGVNGRTGAIFDSAFTKGEPATFTTTGVIAGFTQALVGKKVGSTVAAVITSKDGYAQGNGDTIQAGDTLIFVLTILSTGPAPASSTPAAQ